MTLKMNAYKALYSWETDRNKNHGPFCWENM